MSIERKEWKRAPTDWPRQQADVAEEREVARERRPPARPEEAEERARAAPAVRGRRTQTGQGSTSGWS